MFYAENPLWAYSCGAAFKLTLVFLFAPLSHSNKTSGRQCNKQVNTDPLFVAWLSQVYWRACFDTQMISGNGTGCLAWDGIVEPHKTRVWVLMTVWSKVFGGLSSVLNRQQFLSAKPPLATGGVIGLSSERVHPSASFCFVASWGTLRPLVLLSPGCMTWERARSWTPQKRGSFS